MSVNGYCGSRAQCVKASISKRREKGISLKTVSETVIPLGSYLRAGTSIYQAQEVEILEGGMGHKDKLVYTCRSLTYECGNVDIRKVKGIVVELITDEDEISKIRRAATHC